MREGEIILQEGGTDRTTLEVNSAGGFKNQLHAALATLTDAASIAWDLSTAQVAEVTITANRTLANPTNVKAGATYILFVVQDGTGGHTLSFGSAYKWAGGSAPVMATNPGAVTVLAFTARDTSNLHGSASIDSK